jgi:hypothetical protein
MSLQIERLHLANLPAPEVRQSPWSDRSCSWQMTEGLWIWPAKTARSGFRRCHVRLGGVACFAEFGGSEDRDGQSNQGRAENPGDGE